MSTITALSVSFGEPSTFPSFLKIPHVWTGQDKSKWNIYFNAHRRTSRKQHEQIDPNHSLSQYPTITNTPIFLQGCWIMRLSLCFDVFAGVGYFPSCGCQLIRYWDQVLVCFCPAVHVSRSRMSSGLPTVRWGRVKERGEAGSKENWECPLTYFFAAFAILSFSMLFYPNKWFDPLGWNAHGGSFSLLVYQLTPAHHNIIVKW